MKEHQPDKDIEQFIVSASVIRQADKMPPHLVEYHQELLAGYGIVGQALQTLLAIPKEGWLELIDRLQKNK
ncbi:MAG: hypothetical protein LC127_06255 [Chitinophagales bacterium]|nr:hypothetical protein [Chitinophagales bacterium]